MYRTDFWTLWEKARVGCFKRTASKHVNYLGWNRSPAQLGCMRQVLRPGALGRPRGIRWSGRWEVGVGWRIHVYPWLIHVNVWQKPLQYCKVISLQPIKKKKFSASIIVNKPLVEAWSERWQGRLGGGGPCLPLQGEGPAFLCRLGSSHQGGNVPIAASVSERVPSVRRASVASVTPRPHWCSQTHVLVWECMSSSLRTSTTTSLKMSTLSSLLCWS